MKATLIINPNSGPKSIVDKLETAIQILSKNNIEVEKHISNSSEYSKKIAINAIENNVDLVIAAGGDGTINGICSQLVYSNTPLAIIPTGTANVLANELGIPTRKILESSYITKAIDVIINGQVKEIDLGKVSFENNESKFFAMWCGVGIDAKLTSVKKNPPKSLIGRTLNYLNWFWEAIKILVIFSGSVSVINIDGKTKTTKLYQALVSNGSLYANYFSVSKKAVLDDGLLDVFLFIDEKKRSRVALFLKSLLTRRLESNTDLSQGKKISIKSEKPLPVHVDAETAGTTPIEIEIAPKALKVFVPKE